LAALQLVHSRLLLGVQGVVSKVPLGQVRQGVQTVDWLPWHVPLR
jgi:hypothetical protein